MIADPVSPVILMLEHDADDRFITSQVFEENQYKAQLEFVHNREGVFEYLTHCLKERLPLPAMIIINLHTTPLDGREILKQIKTVPEYRHIPVVILSEIKDIAVARECYALGASSFIQKPSMMSETNAKVTSFFKYWFQTVELS